MIIELIEYVFMVVLPILSKSDSDRPQIVNEPTLMLLYFRYVHDRETGKPKGYGFCEYRDAQTAESAVRNLNAVDFHGRQLRVDSAVNSAGTQNRVSDSVQRMRS